MFKYRFDVQDNSALRQVVPHIEQLVDGAKDTGQCLYTMQPKDDSRGLVVFVKINKESVRIQAYWEQREVK